MAKDLAEELGYSYLDSGAMYRAVTLYFLQHNINYFIEQEVSNALCNISIVIPPSDEGFKLLLNNMDVSDLIRSLEVSSKVSEVAAISAVRTFLVTQQRMAGAEGGIVMDGRDIGTVVFPNADLKIFVDSDLDIRVDRRFKEMQLKDESITVDVVKENLAHRDHIDSTREDSPLRKAEDARILDNSNLSRESQLAIAYAWARETISQV